MTIWEIQGGIGGDLSKIPLIMISVGIIIGAFYSLPLFLIYYYIFRTFAHIKTVKLKLLLILIALSGLYITLYFAMGIYKVFIIDSYIVISTSYALSIILSGLMYNVKKETHSTMQKNTL
jgi:hypothetical protein